MGEFAIQFPPADELRGIARLRNRSLTKGTAFTEEERDAWGLRGLLPPQVIPMERQIDRLLENLRRKSTNLEKYIFLSALQNRNERLFYRLVMENIREIMPLIYTPTVGEACQRFAHIFREPRGLYVAASDRNRVSQVLANWPEDDVRVIVITDGERVLGLGDLGVNGMGICVGKLALYTACAGIHPHQCLPITLDVGTNNRELLEDPLYLGMRRSRLAVAAYDELLAELVVAIRQRFPRALVQFEDFHSRNAFRIQRKFREQLPCFNDDIQGTATVVLAGIMAASRRTGVPLSELRVLFLGAGSAAIGIGQLLSTALQAAGLDSDAAKGRLWYVDEAGLLTTDRSVLSAAQAEFARHSPSMDLLQAIEQQRPHVLVGATGVAGTFTRDALTLMGQINDMPVIFALSNPTSCVECSAEQAYAWSEGKAVYASGSPSDPVRVNGQLRYPSQANNVYVFPGLGLGAVTVGASRISDAMLLASASKLSFLVSEDELDKGALFPDLSRIRSVSLEIAVTVARQAQFEEVAGVQVEGDLKAEIEATMYIPTY